MLKDLDNLQLALADFMSEISERCYYAGWMSDLEYSLWDALVNGERKYGQDIITKDDIQTLKDLSQRCNCWIYFDDTNEETAIDLDIWKEKFKNYISSHPDLRNF